MDRSLDKLASSPRSPAPPLDPVVRIKLSVMMFLQYAIWGSWLPLLFAFLNEYRGISGPDVGILLGIAALGAVIAPFFAGQLADRYVSTEKFLCVSHLLGAVLIWQLANLTNYYALVAFGFFYSVLYSPTLSLTNSLAFHHLPDRDRDFGKVRIWGTIGWIAVGIGMGQWLAHKHTISPEQAVANLVETHKLSANEQPALLAARSKELENDEPLSDNTKLINSEIRRIQVAGMSDSLTLSGALGVVLGLFCLVLPHTPPQKGESQFAAGEAIREVKHNPLLTLFLVAFPISCVHQFYFVRTEPFLTHLKLHSPWINSVFGIGSGPMTIGQISELAVLAFMPFMAQRLSRKTLLSIGLLAYIARFAIFAYLPQPYAVYPALALHGLCFGFFFFIAFMVVDEETTSDVRASAQSLFNLIIMGLGVIVGNVAAGQVDKLATVNGETNYTTLFSIPMWIVVACLVFLLLFYPRTKHRPAASR